MKKSTLICLLIMCSGISYAQDYLLGTTKDKVTEYYIMEVTISKKTGITEVFDRIKPAPGQLITFRKQIKEAREKDKLSTNGFDKLGYYRRKVQYSCKAKKYRQMECTYYDMNGKVIDATEPDEQTKWELIPAGTIREIEFHKVCSL